jgi:hypothetical protein
MAHLKQFGTEGPLGFPLLDTQCRALEALLKSLPKDDEHRYRRTVKAQPPTDLIAGERADVSWISTESVDRVGEVVIARGMDASQYRANPIVTLNHNYWSPSIGKSLWQKRVVEGDLTGVKAKTGYPARPEVWDDAQGPWPSDRVFALVQAGLISGKSIGFLPLKVHQASAKESEKNGWPVGTLVIDEWLLLEYACCTMPCNQDSVVEAVSKALPDVGKDALQRLLPPELIALAKHVIEPPPTPPPTPPRPTPFTSLKEAERAVDLSLKAIDFDVLAKKIVDDAIARHQGRV